MATMYVKDKSNKWNKIDVGRTNSVALYFDYGGCTGDVIEIDMDDVWCADIQESNDFTVNLHRCVTTDIGGVKIDGEAVE